MNFYNPKNKIVVNEKLEVREDSLKSQRSNFIDRFDNGSVTDFIILHYENIYFPAVFNIADLSISIGAIFIIFHLVGIPRGSSQI